MEKMTYWQRRLRSAAYSADQLERLRLIKQLIDSGIRPGKLVTSNLQQPQQLLQDGKKTRGIR